MEKRLEELEARINIISEENTKHKAKIRILEKGLSKSMVRIEELETKVATLSGQNVSETGFETEELMQTSARSLDQHQKQQQQSHDADEKFDKLVKLQHILNGILLNRQQSHQRDVAMERINRTQESLHEAVEGLKLNDRQTDLKMDDLRMRCDSMHEDFKDFKMDVQQSYLQMDGFRQRLASMHKEFGDLKSSLTSKEGIQQVQSASTAMTDQRQDSRREHYFSTHMQLVKEHVLPLNFEDYCKLSALEVIAGTPYGPAFKALTNRWDGDSRRAEMRRQPLVDEYYSHGITTPALAMEEYNRHCVLPPLGTQFYLVNAYDSESYILALERSELRLLDDNSKKEKKSWPMTAIRSCGLNADGQIELEFQEGRTLKMDSWEGINTEIRIRISMSMRK